ncbi:MAG: AAA family ATPase, partial [Bacteroidaceae bacterium]|nr:AAA family ATPase [Bacteroidaceae bacterium]
YKFVEKAFSPTELDYWKRYGILPNTLLKYNVVSLASYESVGEKGPYCYTSTKESPMFGYKGDGFIKIYRPLEKMRFLFGGKKPRPYCFGLHQLPFRGDMVFITGGEKDVLSLASHGFNAVCFNSETAEINKDITNLLHIRFKHIFVLYDMDETGRKAMLKAEQELGQYNIRPIYLPLSGIKAEKDVSDFFSLGHTADELHDIIRRQLEIVYAQSMMLIDTCLMDFEHPPEPSPVVIMCCGVSVGISDNLMCVTGGEGTGKSNVISTFIAGALLTSDDHEEMDTLGFTIAPNSALKAVLHFDTEQSGPHLHKNMETAKRRANLKSFPKFYYAFSMVALTRQQRLQTIRDSMDLYHHRHGGIHLVVIDGAADLVSSANNEAECISLIEELYRLAGMYHTCIVFALHHIPNGLKIRGHIGSETHRKAAGILSVEKDDDPRFSVIKAVKVRDGNALDMPITLITWNTEKRMFVSAGQKSGEYVKKVKYEKLKKAAIEIFKKQSAYTFGALVSAISKDFADNEEGKAKGYLSFMIKEGIIVKTKYNNYKLGDNNV